MAKIKNISQNEFKMTLIKDLGREFLTSTSKVKSRVAIFECTECKIHFRTSVNKLTKEQKYCNKCKYTELITHNMSNLPIYNLWKSMLNRTKSKSKAKYYKDKNIIVCKEWEKFENFYNWAINNGYIEGLSIDRKDGSKNYSASNCRWVDYSTQAANKSSNPINNTSGYIGVHFHKNTHKFESYCSWKGKKTILGYYHTAIEAAKAHDSYIIENNLPHTLNNVLDVDEKVLPNKGSLMDTNTSGYFGVSLFKRTGKWTASIKTTIKDKHHIGYFNSAEEAFNAREKFKLDNKNLILSKN